MSQFCERGGSRYPFVFHDVFYFLAGQNLAEKPLPRKLYEEGVTHLHVAVRDRYKRDCVMYNNVSVSDTIIVSVVCMCVCWGG